MASSVIALVHPAFLPIASHSFLDIVIFLVPDAVLVILISLILLGFCFSIELFKIPSKKLKNNRNFNIRGHRASSCRSSPALGISSG